MALEIIGAGMGRTGTYSLNLALEQLGFGPCHHMADVNTNAEQKAAWRAAGDGHLPDWDAVYAGYRSAVDWPTAHFWLEVAKHFREAKVILTERDPDDWYDSMSGTIAQTMGPASDPDSFGVKVIGAKVFGGRLGDRAHAIQVMRDHNARVVAALPPDRLLVYRVSDGWAPLCAFLGVPVPDEAFPRTNSGAEFRARVMGR